jgi:hypothetical protein
MVCIPKKTEGRPPEAAGAGRIVTVAFDELVEA